MANGNILPNWSFKRKLPEPFEDYTDDPVFKNVYSKHCIQPQKRSTLHAATLRAILAYLELESPTSGKPPEELGAIGSQGNNFTIAEYPSKTGELHVAVYNRTNGKFTVGCYQMPPDPESTPEKYMLKEDDKSGAGLRGRAGGLEPAAEAPAEPARLGEAGGCALCPPGTPRHEAGRPGELHGGVPAGH